MNPYVYIEYPKCLYRGDDTRTVHSLEEEVQHANDGWLTAGQFHGTEPKPVVDPPAPPVEPVVESPQAEDPDKKSSKKGK